MRAGDKALLAQRIGRYIGLSIALAAPLIGDGGSFANDFRGFIVDGLLALVMFVILNFLPELCRYHWCCGYPRG